METMVNAERSSVHLPGYDSVSMVTMVLLDTMERKVVTYRPNRTPRIDRSTS